MSVHIKQCVYQAMFTGAACFSLWQGHLAGWIACGVFTALSAITMVATT
jgi:hypothetical protein